MHSSISPVTNNKRELIDSFRHWLQYSERIVTSAGTYASRVKTFETYVGRSLNEVLEKEGLEVALQLAENLRGKSDLKPSTVTSLPSAIKAFNKFLQERNGNH